MSKHLGMDIRVPIELSLIHILSSLNNEKSLETYDLDIAKKAYRNVKNIKEIEYYTLGDTVSALRYDMMNKNLKEVGLNLKKTSQYDATLRYTTCLLYTTRCV